LIYSMPSERVSKSTVECVFTGPARASPLS